MIDISTNNAAETLALGRRLASMLRAGDVVLLAGGLGVGKTLFASGIGEGLGVEEQMTSPSFILARSHQGFMPMSTGSEPVRSSNTSISLNRLATGCC